jgi:tetratricopeptide (TPR) repeat protein
MADAIADCHQAISRDSEYSKAYLRRARALGASKSYAASIRDYRRYLCSDPTPNDVGQVNQELEGVEEAIRRQIRG